MSLRALRPPGPAVLPALSVAVALVLTAGCSSDQTAQDPEAPTASSQGASTSAEAYRALAASL